LADIDVQDFLRVLSDSGFFGVRRDDKGKFHEWLDYNRGDSPIGALS
jgi:hypothetical protein